MKKHLTRVLASALALLMVVTIAPTELGLSQVHAANYTEAQLKAMKTVEITDGSVTGEIIDLTKYETGELVNHTCVDHLAPKHDADHHWRECTLCGSIWHKKTNTKMVNWNWLPEDYHSWAVTGYITNNKAAAEAAQYGTVESYFRNYNNEKVSDISKYYGFCDQAYHPGAYKVCTDDDCSYKQALPKLNHNYNLTTQGYRSKVNSPAYVWNWSAQSHSWYMCGRCHLAAAGGANCRDDNHDNVCDVCNLTMYNGRYASSVTLRYDGSHKSGAYAYSNVYSAPTMTKYFFEPHTLISTSVGAQTSTMSGYTISYNKSSKTWSVGTGYYSPGQNWNGTYSWCSYDIPYFNSGLYTWLGGYTRRVDSTGEYNHEMYLHYAAAECEQYSAPVVTYYKDGKSFTPTKDSYAKYATIKVSAYTCTSMTDNVLQFEVLDSDKKTVLMDWQNMTYSTTSGRNRVHTATTSLLDETLDEKEIFVRYRDSAGNISDYYPVYVHYLDAKVPVSPAFTTSKAYTNSKTVTFYATDSGSGNLQIACNQQTKPDGTSNYVPMEYVGEYSDTYNFTSKSGTYTHTTKVYRYTYTFTGEVYDKKAPVALYIKDSAGNISSVFHYVYNLDNTDPTVKLTQEDVDNSLETKLVVKADDVSDYNSTVNNHGSGENGASSGVPYGYKYKLFTCDANGKVLSEGAWTSTFATSWSQNVKSGYYKIQVMEPAGNVSADPRKTGKDGMVYVEPKYTVHYEPNAPEGLTVKGSQADQIFTYNREYQLRKNEQYNDANGYSINGIQFLWWNTEPDGSGQIYQSGETVKNLTNKQDDTVTLYAQWMVRYTINHYTENLDGTYTLVETDDYKLVPLTEWTIPLHEYAGWDAPENNPLTVATQDTVIDVHYPLHYYDLSYDTLGGEWYEEQENGDWIEIDAPPATYTVLTPDIHIALPDKVGYDFAGWTGTDVSEITHDVVIPKGSLGDRSYVAHWDAQAYDIDIPMSLIFSVGDDGTTVGAFDQNGDKEYTEYGYITNRSKFPVQITDVKYENNGLFTNTYDMNVANSTYNVMNWRLDAQNGSEWNEYAVELENGIDTAKNDVFWMGQTGSDRSQQIQLNATNAWTRNVHNDVKSPSELGHIVWTFDIGHRMISQRNIQAAK